MHLKKGQIINLKITDLAFGGRGISQYDGLTIFVDGALPGQTVEAKISVKKRRHAEAKTLRVINRSKDEVQLEYQSVPGAPWANLPVETQREFKKNQIMSLFQKIVHLDVAPVFDEYIASPESWFYRNKMDYSFGPTSEKQNEDGQWSHEGFGLGSKKRGQFWLVEPLRKPSGLFDENFESCLPDFSDFCEDLENTAYNSRTNQGFWRQLVVRKSFYEDKFLLNLITNIDTGKQLDTKALIDFWNQKLPGKIKGIFWTQSNDVGNANDKFESRELIFGEPKIVEQMNDLFFEISINSFFQTNIFAAEKLYQKVSTYVSASPEILELFSGTGTISQIMARSNPNTKITSVEIVESAVKDAQKNAEKNGLPGINFICADVFKFLKEYKEKPPTVILDPPRAGIVPKALQKIIDFHPNEIVYVSCNPSTLARDAQTLTQDGDYKLTHLSLVDQFPHTAHTECIAKFAKK